MLSLFVFNPVTKDVKLMRRGIAELSVQSSAYMLRSSLTITHGS